MSTYNETLEQWQEREVSNRRRERFKPLTDGQAYYFKMVETSTITICSGPAGTGKTYIAANIAARMLAEKRIEKIILTRPVLTCDEQIGFLPGSLEEKMEPFVAHLIEALQGTMSTTEISKARREGVIEVAPIAYLRGHTFRKSFVILDEANNATYRQLKMFLTRLGENTRMVICGDQNQTDLKLDYNPFSEVTTKLYGHPDIAIVHLRREDIVRHGLVQWMDERL